MAKRLMTQSEYARYLGVSRQTVHWAVKRSLLTLEGGLVNVARADAEWRANILPTYAPKLRRG